MYFLIMGTKQLLAELALMFMPPAEAAPLEKGGRMEKVDPVLVGPLIDPARAAYWKLCRKRADDRIATVKSPSPAMDPRRIGRTKPNRRKGMEKH